MNGSLLWSVRGNQFYTKFIEQEKYYRHGFLQIFVVKLEMAYFWFWLFSIDNVIAMYKTMHMKSGFFFWFKIAHRSPAAAVLWHLFKSCKNHTKSSTQDVSNKIWWTVRAICLHVALDIPTFNRKSITFLLLTKHKISILKSFCKSKINWKYA